MVNRVFAYSPLIAKNNKLNISIGRLLLEIVGLVLGMTIIIIALSLMFDSMEISLIFTLLYTILLIVYAINKGFKLKAGLMAFATDTEKNLYLAIKLNNGEDFAIGGLALGNVVISVFPNDNNLMGDAIQIAGAALSLYNMNKSLKIMANKEVVGLMVEHAHELSGGIVWKILKVQDIKNLKNSITVICDMENMKNGKIKNHKKIKIYNVYNSFTDLVQELNEKR